MPIVTITVTKPKSREFKTQVLLAWRDDAAVTSVLIDHAGERGFCAGGDIRMIAESGAGDAVAARAF